MFAKKQPKEKTYYNQIQLLNPPPEQNVYDMLSVVNPFELKKSKMQMN